MSTKTTRSESILEDPELRAIFWGVGGGLALLVGGLIVGLIEGNLLPGDCQGLACLFTTVVLIYSGIVFAVWLVVGAVVAWARSRWSDSKWRLWALRFLAVLSWVPFGFLVVLSLEQLS